MAQAVDKIATHWEEEHFGWCWRCCSACKQVAERLMLPPQHAQPKIKAVETKGGGGGEDSVEKLYTAELQRLQARLKEFLNESDAELKELLIFQSKVGGPEHPTKPAPTFNPSKRALPKPWVPLRRAAERRLASARL